MLPIVEQIDAIAGERRHADRPLAHFGERFVVGLERVPIDEAPLADVVQPGHQRLGELGEAPGPAAAESQFAEHQVQQRPEEGHREHDHDPGERLAGGPALHDDAEADGDLQQEVERTGTSSRSSRGSQRWSVVEDESEEVHQRATFA